MAETVSVEWLVGTESDPWTAEEVQGVLDGSVEAVKQS